MGLALHYFHFVLRSVFFLLMLSSVWVAGSDLNIERLTWSGIKLSTQTTTVLIDAVGTDIWGGNAPEALVPVTADTRRRYALVTHLHNDHFDEATLKAVLGEKGYVICVREMAAHLASRGLRVIPTDMYQPVERGGFVFIPIPADDGFGDTQVSWVVRHQEQSFLHGGDTLWHGGWALAGQAYGPFTAAFLPINAPVVSATPALPIPAVMSPEQAIAAAQFLCAKVLVPIHYGLGTNEGYIEVEDPLGKLKAAAKQTQQAIQVLRPGEALRLD